MTPTLDKLTHEPAIGRFYRVPCVFLGEAPEGKWLPILGRPHSDPNLQHSEAEDPDRQHFHFDWRFISSRDALTFWDFDLERRSEKSIGFALGRVHRCLKSAPPEIRILRRKCLRRMPVFPWHSLSSGEMLPLGRAITEMCADKRIDPQNPVCPHRGFPLHNLPRDANNCVTCPGHGARWNMTTGEFVPRPVADWHHTITSLEGAR